jgi:UDP:flavonoid glycosyltransferase YjiC (YdhE family)
LVSNIADWLDSRLAMNRPVLYVAFGSQADLSRAQLEEIATGLDWSDLDFIWVVRSKWFDGEEPFQGRFRDRGKVVQGFINQLGILSHQAIKGFFSHCGWNSVMESISMGVPILTYPIVAEQKLNAKFVVDVLEVGIRIWPSQRGDSGPASEQLVSSDEVETLARELILGEGGKRAAAKASELAASARAAV